ncbi:MAG: hypothetical protein J7L98_06455, partial [Candidatus Verstraetearchaeota archaeon]|nr:hypothetical protein [Candidatus Verstraetearchaeota archaeon]
MNSVKKARSLWNVVKFKGGRCAPLVAAILIVALFASSCLIGNALAQAVVPPHYHDDRYYTKSYVNMFFDLSLSKSLVYVWTNASILPCNDTVTLGNSTYQWSEIYSKILYSSKIYASNLPAGAISDYYVTWNPATGELRYVTSAPSDSDWLVNPTNPAGPAIYNLTHYVGIGTDQPQAKLHVKGGEIWLFWSGQNPRFVIGDSPTTGEYGWLQWDSANNYLRLDTSNAPATGLKIKDNYVSIGNVYPDAPLKVASDTNLLLKVDTAAIEAYIHLLPSTAGSYDLGSSSNYWRALYVENASLKYLLPLTGSDILIKGNVMPVSDDIYWLGSDAYAWARLYAHGVNTDDLYPITGSAIYVHGHLNPDDGSYDLGYYNKRWRNLYIKEYSGGQGFIQMGSSTNYGRFYFYPSDSMFVFTKGIRTYPSGAADLGSSTYHWGSLHVD